MAFIRLKQPVQGKRSAFVSPEQGLQIWRVLVGEIKGTAKQRKFVDNVDGVFLNRSNAPQKYRDWMDRRKPIMRNRQLSLADTRVLQYKD